MKTERTDKKRMAEAGQFKLLPVLLIFAFLCSVSFASLNPKIQLQDYALSEVPAQPGHVIKLTLHLKSIEWDNCADRVSVQLVTTYPLAVQGPDTQYVDSLCLNDSAAKGTFTFLIPVDPLATSGTYPVSVATNYEKRFSKFTESNTVNLRVGGSPSFVASVASSNPVDIYPGDSAAVTIAFQNTGSSMVETARATLSAAEDGIDVKWAGETQELGSIAAHGSSSATFNIEAQKDAAPGIYTLRLSLTYVGEDKSAGTSEFTFSVPLKKKADFTATVPSTAPLPAGEDSEVSIVLKNTGSEDARKLKVRIKPTFPFSTDGTVRYIDSLAPGKSANVTYIIHVDKDGTAGKQIAGFLIDFEDTQGRKFSDSDDFALDVKPKTLSERMMEYWYIAAIIGAALAIVIVRMIVKKIAGLFKKKKET